MDTMTKIWPTKSERAALGWTARYPRPDTQGGHHPALVPSRQRQWDEAERKRLRIAARSAAIHAEREAELQQARDRRQAEIETTRQQQAADDEARLRRRFLAAGGDAAGWELEKGEIVAEHRRRAVAAADAADEAARRAQASRYR
jgi:hypothetical protein